MILGVVVLTAGRHVARGAAACDNSACTPIARTGRGHGVFMIIAFGLRGQNSFAVTEHLTVLPVGKVFSRLDFSDDDLRFFGQSTKINRREVAFYLRSSIVIITLSIFRRVGAGRCVLSGIQVVA